MGFFEALQRNIGWFGDRYPKISQEEVDHYKQAYQDYKEEEALFPSAALGSRKRTTQAINPGDTPFHLFIKDIPKLYLSYLDIQKLISEDRVTALDQLIEAYKNEQPDITKSLGAIKQLSPLKINRQNNQGLTALHICLSRGQNLVLIARALLAQGADTNLVDLKGNHAGHIFFKEGLIDEKILNRILTQITDLDAVDQDGNTLLHLALQPDYINSAIDHQCGEAHHPFKIAREKTSNRQITTPTGVDYEQNKLHYANAAQESERRKKETDPLLAARTLLEKGAKPNVKNKQGKNALYTLLECRIKSSSMLLDDDLWWGNYKELFDKMLELNTQISSIDGEKTILDLALRLQSLMDVRIYIVQKLLEKGANPSITDTKRNHALHTFCEGVYITPYAASESNDLLKLLLNQMTPEAITERNQDDETALMILIRRVKEKFQKSSSLDNSKRCVAFLQATLPMLLVYYTRDNLDPNILSVTGSIKDKTVCLEITKQLSDHGNFILAKSPRP